MNTFLEELDSFYGLIIAARIFHFEKYISLWKVYFTWFKLTRVILLQRIQRKSSLRQLHSFDKPCYLLMSK